LTPPAVLAIRQGDRLAEHVGRSMECPQKVRRLVPPVRDTGVPEGRQLRHHVTSMI
jgi:hypothetical protein